MTVDDIQRVLGKLENGIENLAEQQRINRAEQRADNKLLFDGINNLSANGCAVGRRHDDSIKLQAAQIEELRKRPERVVGFAATIVAIASAIWSTFVARGHQ